MFRLWLSIGVVAALVAAGIAQAKPGVRPAEPAGKYMTAVVKQKLANQYEDAWQSLYPAHQRVASLEAYVACESLTPDAGTLVSIQAMRVFDERIQVAGARRKVQTRAVRMRVVVDSPLFPQFPVVIVQTFHAIAVGGQWKWILSTDQYDYYSNGECPYA
jgi:hypothetical protein